ncbi:hypothetical protein JL721_10518 [Aureococcus anophagefferens]|nr:hypothetical protein JL721_10518 [Aureococcus anophagefferens]
MRSLLAALAITSSTARIGSIGPRAVLGGRSMRSLAVVEPSSTTDGREVAELRTNNRWTTALRGGARGAAAMPPAALRWAYAACGAATTVAWTTVVRTTIRSNQPLGMMVPTFQHGLFARIGAMSAAPIIVTSVAALASAARDTNWDRLKTRASRRLNLAMATACLGNALWVGFAPVLTAIPGTGTSHQAYAGLTRAARRRLRRRVRALRGGLGEDVPETNPLLWPGRRRRLRQEPLQPHARERGRLGQRQVRPPHRVVPRLHGPRARLVPLSVIPSWTAPPPRLPCWTLLAAANCLTLKEAAEDGSLLKDETCKTLAGGVAGFGGVYLASKAGAVFLDPSFPKSYHAVVMSPAWATAAIVLVAFTLKPDTAAA